ncbi:hypothetical protein M2132_000549 [Dysgonomonas sp. PH5-45]|uniref:DUF1573 domain-containing protein n=1 Tax=unclassified Dysgonomonas TaxID=2630389 RepID=UPI0024740AA3|nr:MULTISPECIES: DUF1573 domain-containing protein [unclassified Dysgonomonas]MDH6354222.1 hypothetical protein [Dysgonomonas sp. PH5-45]MDH6387123.1 hypothetical protein [Dysgonomonas sp. PH5-37]
MKKLSLILVSLFLCVAFANAQDKVAAKFDKNVHDFGKVAEEAGQVTSEFTFTNIGKAPLLIQRVAVSCGCTTTSYTKEPVLPGKKGSIKISYSTTGRVGSFNKTTTVFTNVPDSTFRLVIKGEVLPKK